MSEDLTDAIATNAAGPKGASDDTGSMSQHSLTDQVAADKHLKATSALKLANFGMKIARVVPPGSD